MSSEERFATRIDGIDEAPEPFRGAMLEYFPPAETIRLLVYEPAQGTPGDESPSMLFALTDRRWLIASCDDEGKVIVAGCDFNDTLLVELTEILLYCRLKIDYVTGGTVQACVIEFDTVADKHFREAIRLILGGVEGRSDTAKPDGLNATQSIEAWPLSFRNAIIDSLPQGRSPLAAAIWPAVYGGFRRELAPAAALLATDRELVLLSEERAWDGGPRRTKYGHIATYFPLVRLASSRFHRHERFGVLELEMHASHGGETLHILFPTERELEVAQVVECALQRSPARVPESFKP